MLEIYCKAGSVELTKSEAEEIYNNRKYGISKPNKLLNAKSRIVLINEKLRNIC